MKTNRLDLAAAVLMGPGRLKEVAVEIGLTAGQVRVLVGVVCLLKSYSTWIEVTELRAARLLAPTRLRAATSALEAAGYLRRRRGKHRQHLLALTTTGRELADTAIRAIQRAAKGFLLG
ncbi:MarR family winged helix-turn-helix transcriptional regulator [Hymenobacter perfusus]|uniref:MarR family transcriptional regulator n=1 Tax=Hymenobacter perfusus TaxID=1236770 RepID=A0A3R9MHQ3_9BACT|nr:MarR family winged helix-turn-helix transcriptional regulator [Hymenobacter perfusus]RSK46109.1 MarR family transcriptional regulator [Hymenobacter perfusus]